MIDSIRETRMVKDGLYKIMLELGEEDYMTFYEDIKQSYAEDILNQYLKYRQDDARARDVKVEHDRQNHTVNIYADLHYTGNEKTFQDYYSEDYIHKDKK